MEERDYWIWLTGIPGFGPKKIGVMLGAASSPRELFEMDKKQAERLMSGRLFQKGDLNRFLMSRDEHALRKNLEKMKGMGVGYLTSSDENYPRELLGLFEPVHVLYYRGSFFEHSLSIGMVGARKCTAYGRRVAERFAGDLASAGVNVISGLARGIDSHSHIGALDAGGFTTAVLGCGINICYPKENQDLMRRIIRDGCVLSEYGPDVMPKPGLFPMRNRIISALSDGILLIEAKERSGSLITVDYALDYGKDVFAVPGDVLGRGSRGSNNVIRMGGKPVFEASDLLEEYSMNSKNRVNCPAPREIILEEKEKMVYSCISLSPVFVDDLARQTALTMNELQFLLTKLEIKGAVIQLPGKYYIRDC